MPPSVAEVALRPARPADAESAAAIIYETMPTLGEYLFGRPDASGVIRVLAAVFPIPGQLLSYSFSTVAVAGSEVVGVIQALPSDAMGRAAVGLARAVGRAFGWGSALRLAWRGFPLAFEPDTKPGEYYVNTLAVAPGRRNQGIGALLLDGACRRAGQLGFSICSLGVLLHNTEAKRFYEREGFREELKYETRPLAPGVQYTGFYRMIKRTGGTDPSER
jgi:ribosomal protein S18 acetylase RimI-like enzyme